MRTPLGLLVLIASLLLPGAAAAQDSTVPVPDLIGLSLPRAAAVLNAAGLALGEQAGETWDPASELPQNSVSAQAVAAGTPVAPGTSVGVTVARAPNVTLVYDDNDLTLVNQTGESVSVGSLWFNATNGATFNAARWTNILRADQCFQVWSVRRNGPKGLEGCRFIQNWLTTSNPAEHFWTQVSGAQQFTVMDGGAELVRCPAAPVGSESSPLQCAFYFAGGGSADSTDYLYFIYTPDVIALLNPTEDQWMAAGDTPIYNYNPNIAVPGARLIFGDPELFGQQGLRQPGDVRRLAPGQCLVLTLTLAPDAAAPQPCAVVAQQALVPDVAFWLADFEIQSAAGQRHTCPAAIAERPTLCIVPR